MTTDKTEDVRLDKMESELRAMRTIVKLLTELDDGARRRVLLYINDRFPAYPSATVDVPGGVVVK